MLTQCQLKVFAFFKHYFELLIDITHTSQLKLIKKLYKTI